MIAEGGGGRVRGRVSVGRGAGKSEKRVSKRLMAVQN